MRIQDLDQIPDDAIDMSQFLALDDPSQTFKLTLLQLVDALVAQRLNALFVKKAGDIMPGELTFDSGGAAQTAMISGQTSGSMMRDGNGVNKWFSYYDSANGQYRIARYDGGVYAEAPFTISDVSVNMRAPNSTSQQGAEGSSLTRKDYVDSGLAGKVNTTDQSYWNSHGAVADLGTPALARPGYWSFNPGAAESPNAGAYGHGFTVGPGLDQANGVWAQQIAFGHDGKTYYRRRVNVAADNQPWDRFYTTADKPTPADIGASYSMAEGVNFAGKSMATVLLGKNGRNYPITVPLVAGTYWISERGGENADRDYDFGVTISGAVPNIGVDGVGGASVNKIYTM